MYASNNLEMYPGGVMRGENAQDGGYALWTPHRGFQIEIVGGVDDPSTQQHFTIRSPLYGEHTISPDLPLDTFREYGKFMNASVRSAVFGRAFDVSQLTKLESSPTIANTQDFYRVQTVEMVHIFSEVVKNSKEAKFSEDDIYEYVANQLWEDLLHYLQSHGLEIHFDGWNSKQEQSATMGSLVIPAAAPDLLDSGILRSLDRSTGTFSMKKPLDCISAKKEAGRLPGLDFDKFHYTMTEAALWFSDYDDPKIHDMILRASDPKSIDLTADGQLYFKDPELALFFSKTYLLLTTEHWNDVMQRLQIFAANQAFSLSVVRRILRSIKTDDGGPIDAGVTMNPQDYAYGIDSDLDAALKEMVCEGDEYANILQELLKTVGMQERGRMINNKRRVYADFLNDPYATEYPSANYALSGKDGHTRKFGPSSPMVDVRVYHNNQNDLPRGVMPRFTDSSSGFVLDTLKVRSIDPLVRDHAGRIVRLSEHNKRYDRVLKEHEVVHNTSVEVQLMLTPDYIKTMKKGYEETTVEFDRLRGRDHLSEDRMRMLIFGSAKRAKEVAKRRGVLIER